MCLFDELMGARPKGSFFNQRIKGAAFSVVDGGLVLSIKALGSLIRQQPLSIGRDAAAACRARHMKGNVVWMKITTMEKPFNN